MSRERDESRMLLALEEARAAMNEGEIPVGAILTDGEGNVIAKTHNRTECDHTPLAHAEMLAIAKACGEAADWRLHALRHARALSHVHGRNFACKNRPCCVRRGRSARGSCGEPLGSHGVSA